MPTEPTLQDVLDAIGQLRVETRGDLAKLDARVGAVEAKVDAHRLETEKGFRELDAELARHADVTHRNVEEGLAKLEKRVAALEKRPARTPARAARRR